VLRRLISFKVYNSAVRPKVGAAGLGMAVMKHPTVTFTPSYEMFAPEPVATVWSIVNVHTPMWADILGLRVKLVPSKLIQELSRAAPPLRVAVRVEVTAQEFPQALIAGEASLLAAFTVPLVAATVLGLLVLLTLMVLVTCVGGSQVKRLQLQVAPATITVTGTSIPALPA
jgi:hypothetical protein